MTHRQYLRSRNFSRTFSHIVRVLAPTLIALSFAGVAHAQGTMDFSGAQTLMGTFNVRTTTVEIQVELPDAVQLVAEEPVGSVGRE